MTFAPPGGRDRTLWADSLLVVVCAGLTVFVVTRAFAEQSRAAPPRVTVGRVEGSVNELRRRVDGSLVWNDLEAGDGVAARDTVFVGLDSSATVVLDDGARLELGENSLVVIRREQGAEDQSLHVDLLRGVAVAKAGASSLQLNTDGQPVKLGANSAARLRTLAGGGGSVSVSGGQVRVGKTDGRELVAGDRGVLSKSGLAVTRAAVTLLAPEGGSYLPAVNGASDILFRWSAHAGECSLELSEDGTFEAPRVVRGRGGSLVVRDVAEGVHSWRVRCEGLDDGGRPFIGESEERTLTVVVDRAPDWVSPRPNEVVDQSKGPAPLALTWTQLKGVTEYELQLARGSAFDGPLITARTSRPGHLVEQVLEEADYCARVRAARSASQPAARWSQHRCFKLLREPMLRAPRTFAPDRETLPQEKPTGTWLWSLVGGVAWADGPRSAVVLRWEAVPGAAKYLLEISEDEAFSRVVVKTEVGENYFRWPTVVRRDHFWRVRALDATGRQGQVSEPVKLGSEVSPPAKLLPERGAEVVYGDQAPNIPLSWSGSRALSRYRVEIGRTRSFAAGARSFEVEQPSASFTPDSAGTFHWRVTGIDVEGRSTQPSETLSFTVITAPPELLRPTAGAAFVLDAERVELPVTFTRRPVAEYEVEYSLDSQFKKRVSRVVVREPSARIGVDQPGLFHLRVRGRVPQTAFGAPRSLRVKLQIPSPASPADGATTVVDSDGERFEWDAVPPSVGYELKVTRPSDGFSRTVSVAAREHGTAPWAQVTLEAGSYRWTVRALHRSTLPSDWARARALTVVAARAAPLELVALPDPAPSSVTGPTAEVVTPPVDKSRDIAAASHFEVGALLGPLQMLGGPWGAAVTVEARYRRSTQRFGGALRLGYDQLSATAGDDELRSTSTLHSAPLSLQLLFVPVEGAWEPSVAFGPTAMLRHATVQTPGQPGHRVTRIVGGATASAGLARVLGPGRLLADISFSVVGAMSGMVQTAPASVTFALGYRFTGNAR